MSDVLPEAPAVFPVGGSKISKERVSGPPSKMYPVLRDLATASKKASIRIEIDTEVKRLNGQITGLIKARSGDGERLILNDGISPSSIYLSKIIAFRVLEIKVDSLPVEL